MSTFSDKLISNMPRLHHLNVSHNLLTELLDETFSKSEELISLDISYNRLESFNEFTFRGLEVLEVCAVQTFELYLIKAQVIKQISSSLSS